MGVLAGAVRPALGVWQAGLTSSESGKLDVAGRITSNSAPGTPPRMGRWSARFTTYKESE